jgi:hypothetical protein
MSALHQRADMSRAWPRVAPVATKWFLTAALLLIEGSHEEAYE